MNRILAVVALLAAATGVFADTHTWVGGNSSGGGWNVAANWTNEVGEAECPSAGDVALLNRKGETVVANDDDAALFCSLQRVKLDSWADDGCQTLVLDVSTNVLVGCAINGYGTFIKRGDGTATLDSTCRDGMSAAYGYWAVYDLIYGGICVEAGTLVFPQGKDFSYCLRWGGLTVAAGATVVLPDTQALETRLLRGEGTIVQRGDTVRTLQIGLNNEDIAGNMPIFAGKLTGKIKVLSYAYQGFTGTESDMSSDFMIYTGTDLVQHHGVTGLGCLGRKGQPSSVGNGNYIYLMYLGNLLYLGEGETTDRNIQIDTRPNGYHANGIDGGVHGGLRIEGALEWAGWGAGGNECWWQNSFWLAGTNAAPCTLAGPLALKITHGTTNFYHYIIKQGSGTWGIEENSKTTFRGVFDVREGTFQFNSLREAGTLCALGYGDVLTEEYYGKYDPAKVSEYALRLGAPDSTNAVLEYVGTAKGASMTRKLLLNGDGHLRATSGTLDFGGVSATAGEKAKTLVLDGASTGENTLRDVTDGDGTLSVAKEGPGTWYLVGDKTAFTGDLSVREGTLRLYKEDVIHRYFRVAFLDGYGNPHGCYICDFALYDAEGRRQNLGLTYAKPDNVPWDSSYSPYKVARTLLPGQLAFDSLSDTAGCSAYAYSGASLNKFADGTSSIAQFVNKFSASTPGVVSMRLADDCPEIVAMDFSQYGGTYLSEAEKASGQYDVAHVYQTASKFQLESSADGVTWQVVAQAENLPYSSSGRWYYTTSGKTSDNAPGDRTLGEGEGLAFTARAMSASTDEPVTDLSSVRAVSVAAGATLEADPAHPVTVDTIMIDAKAGSGSFKNVRFSADMTIDVTGLEKGEDVKVPVDFTNIANFDEVESWTFLQDGQPTRFVMSLSKTELDVRRPGMTLIVR